MAHPVGDFSVDTTIDSSSPAPSHHHNIKPYESGDVGRSDSEAVSGSKSITEEPSSKAENKGSKTDPSSTPIEEEPPSPNIYIRFLCRYPAVVILSILVIVGACIGITVTKKSSPDFSNPLKGFTTRGTPIYMARKTATDVLRAYNMVPPSASYAKKTTNRTARRLKRSADDKQLLCSTYKITERHVWKTKLVLTSTTSGNLLTTASLRAICEFVDEIILPIFPHACPGKSIASRLAKLRGKTCTQLDDDDVSYARELLDKCVPFYKRGKLKENATATHAQRAVVPGRCYEDDFVYTVMHYFADVGFYDKSNDLKYTIVYVHYVEGDQKMYDDVDNTFFEDHIGWEILENGFVRLVTVGFHRHDYIKYTLFEKYLLRDLTYFGLAGVLIALFTLIYLLSFSLSIGTLLNIPLSFGFAYFLYCYVWQMVFFPFINLLSLLILIAVGADDVFLFYDTWLRVKAEHPTWQRDQCMSLTFSHAIRSICVTSFTTAAAFLTNIVSTITAIRCFGIFAALAIMANLAMVMTIMPAIVVASEACLASAKCPCGASTCDAVIQIPNAMYSWIAAHLKYIFHTTIPFVIRRAWHVCIAAGLAVGVAALVIVFYKPALKPPSTNEFQMFNKDNVLEKWDLDFKHRFPAEIAEESKHRRIIVTILFGFKATDPGNRFDPDDTTKSLSRDEDFNMDHNKTRDWLAGFCDKINNASFAGSHKKSVSLSFSQYDNHSIVVDYACAMLSTERFSENDIDFFPNAEGFPDRCCEHGDMKVLTYCVNWLNEHRVTDVLNSNVIRAVRSGFPLYDNTSKDRFAFGYQLDLHTTFSYTWKYEEMRTNYDVLTSYMDTHLTHAPNGLRSGFFSGNHFFEFYDLQHSLAIGTTQAVSMSVVVSFVVLLVTVRNVLIAIYAMLTIVFSIASTVASIVLMGWKLNIVESITIILAVGMSIDFTIHYGVVYQLTTDATSAGRTRTSIQLVGSSVAAGAGTTFSAGVAVLHCSVDPYHKLGVFLVLVMLFSWVYSTFFFLSLCHAIGPVNNVCQIPSPARLVRQRKQRDVVASSATSTRNTSNATASS